MFGGYMYGINRTFVSNKLYAFHYPTRFWSILPTFEEYNPPRLNLVCIYSCLLHDNILILHCISLVHAFMMTLCWIAEV